MQSKLSYLLSILVVLTLGILSGWLGGSGDTAWYQTLQKPFLHPPAWIFGPVWTILYIMLGIIFLEIKRYQPKLLALFVIQLILNFIWTPMFFHFHLIQWALLDLVLMVILNLILLIQARKQKHIFFLLLPYNLWLWFACYLNASIVFLNLGH